MRKLIFVILMCVPAISFSQVEIIDLNWSLDSRNVVNYDDDYDEVRERTQGRVRVGFTIDVDGEFELVGVASTGPNFDSSWADIYDTQGGTTGRHLTFRNLYIRKVIDDTIISAGALPAEPTVGSAGQSAPGWLDGIKVETETKVGNFKVIAGSLGDFDEPNAFRRKFKGNFIEIEMEREVFEDLLVEAGIQNYNGDFYLRSAATAQLKVLGDRVINLFAASLYDIERGGHSYDVGVEVDVLKNLIGKYDGRLKLQIFYSNIDESMPDRHQMVPVFHTFGERTTVHLSGKIDKKGHFNWYYRSSMGETKRRDIGITLKIPLGPRRR